MTFDKAMQLWMNDPPMNHWLKLEIGVDGWTVEVVTHGEHQKDLKVVFSVDDYDYSYVGLPAAIGDAYYEAVELGDLEK